MSGCDEYETKGPRDCNSWCIPESYDEVEMTFVTGDNKKVIIFSSEAENKVDSESTLVKLYMLLEAKVFDENELGFGGAKSSDEDSSDN